jgi:hypothetical protein
LATPDAGEAVIPASAASAIIVRIVIPPSYATNACDDKQKWSWRNAADSA